MIDEHGSLANRLPGGGRVGDPAGVDVVAQWVRTSWTKQSRGGPAATVRNAAPVGFLLPAGNVPPFTHHVVMAEGNDFRPNGDITPGPPVDGVSLRESDGRLRVHLEPSPFGTPRRWRRPPAVHLQPGESVRWQANYRFVNSGDGSWYYRLDTLNLGFGPMPTDAFVGRPTHQVTELAYLR